MGARASDNCVSSREQSGRKGRISYCSETPLIGQGNSVVAAMSSLAAKLRARRQHMLMVARWTSTRGAFRRWIATNASGAADGSATRMSLSTSPPLTSSSMPRIMHPDWYRTPSEEDDPRMIGDYPAVPASSYQTRDPHARYYDQQNRRYFGEPVPEDYEPLIMWSFDVEERFGVGWAVASLGSLLGGCFLLYQLCGREPSVFATQRVPKELPTVSDYYRGGAIPEYLRRD